MSPAEVEKLFRYTHLPTALQNVSKPFFDMAMQLCHNLPASAELTLAIRKLWEAKNLAVYAAVDAGFQ
jgi:hypothetical protein